VLEKHLGKRQFSDLRLPCALAAVDIRSGKEIVLREGRLLDAVLATIAIPGIFPPKMIGDYQLVDGAVLNPVPVSLARMLAPHLPIIAVSLSARIEPGENPVQVLLPAAVPSPIVETLTRTRLAQAFGIFVSAVDIGDRMITELRLKVDRPDVIIRPEVGGIGILDKVDVHKIVRQGEKAVDAALPDLRQAVSWPNRIRRHLVRSA
jgi:NTE family protein